ncbi:MAG: Ribonuclease 3 [Candidatus Moranbacteria bacterium GW2011_GWE1_35_17]|nr:MAG: Ribonuclease 3 [Candidatus Moranbacteria bacterium GW2011_GWE1_35_17]KKP70431.1 MAG: Ribonuclease 3 [Candidatus Moranbacteria bacterium GW2011_GWE2_35_164]KKP80817.1 MAG: Ribonuclease 3 [Candidatus Moranbacteria bacterium GW2011_GWF1_35_5]KKP82169.1 MAG: Ribonuclease 3 [Candidatus Moranbacteria bacterium GW2011_GWF2_35_54]
MVKNKFAESIGIEFNNLDLIQEALTHRSYLNENKKYKLNHNERLEFLGDAVLELVVTDYLFKNYSNNQEGEMTSWRAALVNGEMLAKISAELKVDEYVLMSKGEASDKGRARQYLLANALEAIIGAIYLDQGYAVAEKFILENVVTKIDNVIANKLYLDPKSYFQEKSQEHFKMTPSYRILKEEGPDHDKNFTVGVYIGDELIAQGNGASKQEAQREAAQEGLKVKGWM